MKNIFSLFRQYRIIIWPLFFISVSLLLINSKLLKKPNAAPWNVKPTEHLLLYYEKNSPAEKDIEILAKLLEGYFQETAQVFNIKITKKIPYYFHRDKIYHANMPIWGYASLDDIHVIYSDFQKDSSPHELRHFIHQRVNPYAPYFFNEGACGLGIQIGGEGFHAKASVICFDLSKYSLLELVKDFQRFGRLGDYLAYSFNSFLIEQYGRDKFANFYKRINKDNWQEIMKEVYGFSSGEVEAKWKDFLCQ